jgi:hypothetical protein
MLCVRCKEAKISDGFPEMNFLRRFDGVGVGVRRNTQKRKIRDI